MYTLNTARPGKKGEVKKKSKKPKKKSKKIVGQSFEKKMNKHININHTHRLSSHLHYERLDGN